MTYIMSSAMACTHALLRLASRLAARRDALRKTLKEDLASFRTVAELSGVGDFVDTDVDSANSEIGSRLVEIERRELSQVDHALKRIAAGVYGRCAFCGGRISASRLNALPYADSCIDCQREIEMQGCLTAEADADCWDRVDRPPIDGGESDATTNRGEIEIEFREFGRRSLESLLV